MRNIGFRAKLLGVTLFLLVALTAGALLTVRHHFGRQLHHQAERELTAGTHVLNAIFERSSEQLVDRARLLVELPSLQTALSKEPEQLEPLLLEVKSIRAANLVWATDPTGRVLASTAEYPPPGEDFSQKPLIQTALSGEEVVGFDLFSDAWWFMVNLPVYSKPSKNKDAPELLGSVTLALMLGEAYADRLSELIETEVAFIWRGHTLWSNNWPDSLKSSINKQVEAGFADLLEQGRLSHQEQFLWSAQPIQMGRVTHQDDPPLALLGAPLDETVIQKTTAVIGWIALLTVGLGALLLAGFTRSMIRPLKILVSDSQRIGAGDLAYRSQVQSSDEIGELAASFNQMVERLESSYGELADLNETLEKRVAQRTEELKKTQEELLQSKKLASIGQLAAGVAHELNNPLMVIMGNTQMALRLLTRGKKPLKEVSAELQELLEDLNQQSHRSKTIVQNLLDFARVHSVRRTETNISDLFDESIRLVGHQADLASIQIKRKLDPKHPTLRVDPNQLKQVFVNLIVNAVQAMSLKGTLTLKTEASSTHLKISIQDTGEGIPQSELDKIFDPFFTTKEVGSGTGLGLSICHGIIQRHDGTMKVESQKGKGTTIVLELPLKVAEAKDSA